MLNPFRIRNLYFNTSDWGDQSGVVQISSQQYDQEVQATPDARFSYLDEDDGETVTVSMITSSALQSAQHMDRLDRLSNLSNDS